jgi:hypothetical protein
MMHAAIRAGVPKNGNTGFFKWYLLIFIKTIIKCNDIKIYLT